MMRNSSRNYYANKQRPGDKSNQWLLKDQMRMFEQYAPALVQQPSNTINNDTNTVATSQQNDAQKAGFLTNVTMKVDFASPRYPVGTNNGTAKKTKQIVRKFPAKKPTSGTSTGTTTSVSSPRSRKDLPKLKEETFYPPHLYTQHQHPQQQQQQQQKQKQQQVPIVRSREGLEDVYYVPNDENSPVSQIDGIAAKDAQVITSPFKSNSHEKSSTKLSINIPQLAMETLELCESDFLGNSARSVKSPTSAAMTDTARSDHIIVKRPLSAPKFTNHSYMNSMKRFRPQTARSVTPKNPSYRPLSQISFDFDKRRRGSPRKGVKSRESVAAIGEGRDPESPDGFIDSASSVERFTQESMGFMSDIMGFDFALEMPLNAEYIEPPSFEQHIVIMNDKIHELTIIFKEKLRQQHMIHRKEIEGMEKFHAEQLQMAINIYDTKVDEMIAKYQDNRSDKINYLRIKQENVVLKKKVKEMKAEITTLTTNDAKEKAHRAKEEENRRISQIHKSEIMFAEFKNALPEDSRLNIDSLFDEDGLLYGADIVDQATILNKHLVDQLTRAKETTQYLKSRLMSVEEQLLRATRSALKIKSDVMEKAIATKLMELSPRPKSPEPPLVVVTETHKVVPPLEMSKLKELAQKETVSTPRDNEVALPNGTEAVQAEDSSFSATEILEHLRSLHKLFVQLRKPIVDMFSASKKMKGALYCCNCRNIMKKPYALWKCGHNFCIFCLKTAMQTDDTYTCTACGSRTSIGFIENVALGFVNPNIMIAEMEGRNLATLFNEVARVWNEKMLIVKDKITTEEIASIDDQSQPELMPITRLSPRVDVKEKPVSPRMAILTAASDSETSSLASSSTTTTPRFE